MTSLNLFGNTSDRGPVTAVGMRGIAEAIQHGQIGNCLEKLVVSRNTSLGDAGVALIADALPAVPALVHLDISNTRCGDAGMIAIAAALGKAAAVGGRATAVGANLSELVLYGNDSVRGTSGWSALAGVLPVLRGLQRLDCNRCSGMRCEGASAIAAALPRCPALESLSLARCAIGDMGAGALAAAIGASMTARAGSAKLNLCEVDASWNRMGGEAIRAVLLAGAGAGLVVEQTPGGFTMSSATTCT